MSQESPNSSLFQMPTPTDEVKLPSKGKFYPEGHPLCDKLSVTVYYPSAVDDDILSDPDAIRDGTATPRVLKRLLVDKNIDPDTLETSDVNAIMMSIRINSKGSGYYVKNFPCPSCGKKTPEYDFDIEQTKIFESMEVPGLEILGRNLFSIQLPQSKYHVTFKLLMQGEVLKAQKDFEEAKKKGLPIKENLEVTVKTIVSIQTPDKQQEIKEPSTIREFVYSMLALDKTEYDTAYKMLAPLVKLDLNFDCFSCDFKGDVEVPLTPEFFWPTPERAKANYDEIFMLAYKGNLGGFAELYNLPTPIRLFFIERLQQQLQAEADAIEEARNSSSS